MWELLGNDGPTNRYLAPILPDVSSLADEFAFRSGAPLDSYYQQALLEAYEVSDVPSEQ